MLLLVFSALGGESPFYQSRLRGPAPDRLYYQPDDPRTPDKDFCAELPRRKYGAW